MPFFDDTVLVGRKLKHVNRVVEARLGVDVRTEAGAGGLECRNQFARLEVTRSVEPHVLEKMCESLLLVGLVDRAGLDRELQHHALLGPPVTTNVVASGRSAAFQSSPPCRAE